MLTPDHLDLVLDAITKDISRLDHRLRELLAAKTALRPPATTPTRVMSPEAKAKISKAMKKRWKQSRHGTISTREN